MRPLLLCFSIAVALVAATPTHQVPRSERGSSSKFVNVVSNPVRHTAAFVRRQKQPANGSSDGDPLTSLSEERKAEIQKATEQFTKPLGNAAVWKEAYDFDLERGDIHDNRVFYHTIAFFQLVENSSLTLLQPKNIDGSYADQNISPVISKALQYLQFYPAQLKQPQANDPGNTIGKLERQYNHLFSNSHIN